ncbi:ABC transporter ATP-binding protein [Uliginosibacterium gangwonense]|uniref:ABC transporter ATP-binding protein n=1 Tax=Uliginosibacterium gangwonense TaxID=392736 RepID=UPI00037E4971|nr:sn-glycerol-3-phosphate ABC transporter ATP-binding protein UgpC [Uliginosibacterium gangwonense]
MSGVTLRNVRKTYPDGTQVLHGIDLEIKDGEFTVFVGPSGCGKTTLLRMIAGLEDITDGEIRIGDTLINDIPPAERGVAMVFQSYALYPHMTVAENMGFALKLAGKSKEEIKAAVGRAAEILQINPLLNRKPKALSGGQRQRVAIGRAIVRTPKVFLFDEPLSNLDAALRVQMRIELSKLHDELGATMIYVTHDQVEAMTMGDRIAVFHKGLVQQYGQPLDLYESPKNRFVAGFLGSPQMNFLPCTLDGKSSDSINLHFGAAGHFSLPAASVAGQPTGELMLGVRPEHIQLGRMGEGLGARIDILEHLGDSIIVYAKLHGSDTPLAIRLPGEHIDLRAGNDVSMIPKQGRAILFNGQGLSVTN